MEDELTVKYAREQYHVCVSVRNKSLNFSLTCAALYTCMFHRPLIGSERDKMREKKNSEREREIEGERERE